MLLNHGANRKARCLDLSGLYSSAAPPAGARGVKEDNSYISGRSDAVPGCFATSLGSHSFQGSNTKLAAFFALPQGAHDVSDIVGVGLPTSSRSRGSHARPSQIAIRGVRGAFIVDKAQGVDGMEPVSTNNDKAQGVDGMEPVSTNKDKAQGVDGMEPASSNKKPGVGVGVGALLAVGATAALIHAVKGLVGVHTPIPNKLHISLGGDLTGQGFLPPDFNVDHLKQQIRQTMAASRRAAEAADKAEDASTVAASAFEQAARHAERVGRLPGTHSPPTEAFGDADGFFPPRRTWGSKFL